MSQLALVKGIRGTGALGILDGTRKRIRHHGAQRRHALPERFGLVITEVSFASPMALQPPWWKVG